MDLLRIIYRLRPDVTWAGNVVDASSKAALERTYQSSQPFPTNQEGLAAWAEIEAEDAAAEALADQLADLEKAEDWLTNQITPMSSLSVEDRVALRDILLRMFKYLKYGK